MGKEITTPKKVNTLPVQAPDHNDKNQAQLKIVNEHIEDSEQVEENKIINETPKKEKWISPEIFTPLKDKIVTPIKENSSHKLSMNTQLQIKEKSKKRTAPTTSID